MNAVMRFVRKRHLRQLKKEVKRGKLTQTEVDMVQDMSDEEYEEYARKVLKQYDPKRARDL